MVNVLWDDKGMVCFEFLECGTTMNTDHYTAALWTLQEAINKKGPQKQLNGIQLHHDNAQSHIRLTALIWHPQTFMCSVG